jgi:hypothetical protein
MICCDISVHYAGVLAPAGERWKPDAIWKGG